MKPEWICFDYETSDLTFWRDDFKVISCAFVTSTGQEEFVEGKEAVAQAVQAMIDSGARILVFNASFEFGVSKYALGIDLPLDRTIDVMRLVQLWGFADGTGWGLQSAARRLLGVSDYKEKYYAWLRENVPEARKKPGAFLSRLPRDLLEQYNLEDVRYTAQLYVRIAELFLEQHFDFRPDHSFYMQLVRWVTNSKARGIPVNRADLVQVGPKVDAEVAEIDHKFEELVGAHIQTVRDSLPRKKSQVAELPPFNLRSPAHMRKLFVGCLGLRPRFFTPKGSPSFKSAHLGQWGAAGQVLEKRGKRLKVKEAAEKLLVLSEEGGRWHADLRLVGTVTGRLAGGSQ